MMVKVKRSEVDFYREKAARSAIRKDIYDEPFYAVFYVAPDNSIDASASHPFLSEDMFISLFDGRHLTVELVEDL